MLTWNAGGASQAKAEEQGEGLAGQRHVSGACGLWLNLFEFAPTAHARTGPCRAQTWAKKEVCGEKWEFGREKWEFGMLSVEMFAVFARCSVATAQPASTNPLPEPQALLHTTLSPTLRITNTTDALPHLFEPPPPFFARPRFNPPPLTLA
eukprot:1628478-Rhodomonas_salina.4